MTEPRSKLAPKATPPKPDAPAEATAPPSRLSWLVGWVLVPGLIIGIIFGGGALVGAHWHDSWLARAIVWVVALFV
jgi:hypothetical protein